MIGRNFILILLQTLVFSAAIAQKKNETKSIVVKDTTGYSKKINPLAPARAGFYSAILPGLGQAYNKKYWKIPIVYAALGSGIYLYISNDKLYNSFRNEYKSRLAGNEKIDYPQYSNETLIVGQKGYRRNRDLSLLFCFAMYALNIVDANVDAHLMQFNVNDNLSLAPDILTNPLDFQQNAGISMKLKF